jgi:hypothetical protein
MKYYAIYDETELMMMAEIPEGRENELLRVLEVASMISEAPNYKEVTEIEYMAYRDLEVSLNELN